MCRLHSIVQHRLYICQLDYVRGLATRQANAVAAAASSSSHSSSDSGSPVKTREAADAMLAEVQRLSRYNDTAMSAFKDAQGLCELTLSQNAPTTFARISRPSLSNDSHPLFIPSITSSADDIISFSMALIEEWCKSKSSSFKPSLP